MKLIKIAYSNMWWDKCPADYLLECYACLRGHYRFEFSDNPQLAIYSVYNNISNRYPNAVRVVISGESGDDFGLGGKGICEPGFFHFGITGAREQHSPNHRYMPIGFLHLNLWQDGVATLLRPTHYLPPWPKEFFCNFIYSNGGPARRLEIFQKLSRYKRVEACGAVARNNNDISELLNTEKERYQQKRSFQSRCKFSLAIENTIFPGYNTEKITDPFVAGSVPIYFGDPRIAESFNPKAFLNWGDYDSDEEAIEYIEAVDKDDALYSSYLNAPPFPNNRIPTEFSDAAYLEFWKTILDPI